MLVGQNLTGAKSELAAQMKFAEVEVQLAERRLAVHQGQRKALTVVAPVDGRLLALPRRDQTGVNRGDVAVIEAAGAPEVTAYLKPENALHIGIGDPALVSIPAQRKAFKARVVRIDRPGQLVSESQRWSGAEPRRPSDDRMVQLVLRFDWVAGGVSPAMPKLGTPAVLTLERPDRQRLREQIDQGLGGLMSGARDTYRYVRDGLVQAMIDGAAPERCRAVAMQ